MVWKRVSVGVFAAMLCGLSAPAAAAASTLTPPATVHDAAGDVPIAQDDILTSGFVRTATSLVFGTDIATPTDPSTDAAWLAGRAFMYWELDTDNDVTANYNIMAVSDGQGGLHATMAMLTDQGTPIVCAGAGAFVAGYGYTVTLAQSCLPANQKFRFRAAFSYTADAGPSEPTDFAPSATEYGPVVVNALPVKPVKPVKPVPPVTPVTPKSDGPNGYWMLGADGRVYGFGGAVAFSGTQAGAIAMAPRRDGKGYWVTDGKGAVRAFGAAVTHGGSPALGSGESVTTIAGTASDKGYWLFSNRGRAFAFGDAQLYGDVSTLHLNGAIVASAVTAAGKGYYMIGTDGGIFAFGDARFRGSTGAMRLNEPIVGMAPTRDGRGYWLVASDGGVFAFAAPFRGSMGGNRLNQPVDGLVAYGNGYLMAAADGGVFDFSNKPFAGSLAAHPPAAPIIGLAAFSPVPV
jgi:hypothetical protein